MKIDGTVALVTGGGSGIGAAVATELANRGARIVLGDVDAAGMDRTADHIRADGGEVMALELDVTDRAAWRAAADRIRAQFGSAHILVNNAGVASRQATVGELAPEIWDRLIGINLTGVFNGGQSFLSAMLPSGDAGHIVNTASICGFLSGPMIGAYVASKFAVVGLSETMRIELADRGVGVSLLCPGFVATQIVGNSVRYGPDDPVTAANSAERQARAERIAGAMPPQLVAAQVAQAIEDNSPYVFTHGEYAPAVENRFAGVMKALHAAAPGTPSDDVSILAAAWVGSG